VSALGMGFVSYSHETKACKLALGSGASHG
jgi:hypothetical protein